MTTPTIEKRLSVRRVLRAMSAPICECAEKQKVYGSTIGEMGRAGMRLELTSEGNVHIEVTAAALAILKAKVASCENIEDLVGGKGPFFRREGKPPHVRNVAELSQKEVLEILLENTDGISVDVLQSALSAIDAAA